MAELSKKQQKWCDDLERLLDQMPAGIEIVVQAGGIILVAEHGALAASSTRSGDCDYADVDFLETIIPKRSVKHRIDGRDSQL